MSNANELKASMIAMDIMDDHSTHETVNSDTWTINDISMKECCCFVPATKDSVQKCACGLIRSQHKSSTAASRTLTDELDEWAENTHDEDKVLSDNSSEWSSNTHTREIPTNAFGKVSFSQNQQDEGIPAKYIRLSDSTSVDRLWYIMKNYWGLKPPALIISVVGGNRDGIKDMDVQKKLEEGLTKIINQVDTWLVTGATSTKITNLVSKVFTESYNRDRWNRNACIGVAPWGIVHKKDSLESTPPAKSLYIASSSKQSNEEYLNKNQTHFLLVDNGTSGKYGNEREFRVKLERYLCNSLDSKAIPSVSLLVHGGYHACMQIKENLNGHPNIPTFILKGSGGLADIIANAFRASKEGTKGFQLQKWITVEISKCATLRKHEDLERAQIRNVIKEIVEKCSEKVKIYDPKSDTDGLDYALIEACISCSVGTLAEVNKLELAMHLGKPEAIARDIQGHGVDDDSLYSSIKSGNSKSIEFVLKQGADLQKFVDVSKQPTVKVKKLRYLYEKKITHGKVQIEHGQTALLLFLLELNGVEDLNSFEFKYVNDLLDTLLEGDYNRFYYEEEKESAKVTMTPAQQLIIWAILNDMADIVECFWKFDTENALENALIIFRLYKAISKLCESNEIQSADLMSVANKYETRAVELLSWYYKKDAAISVDIVQTRIALWGNKNLVTLAANGNSRAFVAHPCCQEHLTNVWLGRSDRETIKRKSKQKDPSSVSNNESQFLVEFEGTTMEDGPKFSRPSRCENMTRKLRKAFRFFVLVPKGKLFLHQLNFTIFLCCFAYFVLIKAGPHHGSLRYFIFTMVTALMIDEIREIAEVRKKTLWLKIKEWQKSGWNRLDALAMCLFYVGFIVGLQGLSSVEKIIMAGDLVLWVIKFVQFYRMFYTLGPYLIMINKMVSHMIGFILVLIIAVIAYGIFMHTLLFPDVSVSWDVIFKLLFRPYLLVFGELGVNSYKLSNTKTIYGTKKTSGITELMVVFGMCVYLLVANVLLLNMLIAVFNNIYEDVKNHSDQIWRFDKYDMIMEYRRKPMLPIPFSILVNAPKIFLHMCGNAKHWESQHEEKFPKSKKKKFQETNARVFFRECGEKPTMDEKLDLINQRSEKLSKSMLELEGWVKTQFVKLVTRAEQEILERDRSFTIEP